MKQEMIIKIAARKNVPETSISIIVYTKSGRLGERDAMIMVPGGPGNDYTTYDSPDHSIAKALLPYIDIILFDPRGCGNSEKSPTEFCSLEHYIDDIENIRDYFKIPFNQFVLFGQSYGSIAALGYAIRYHSTLKKLIIIGGAASGEFLKEAQENLLKRGNPLQKKFGEKIWTATFTGSPEEVSEFYEVMGPLYSYSFKPGAATDVALTYNVDVLNFGFGKFLKKFDYRPSLSQIKCQTLILWGEDEWIFDKKQINIIHSEIKNSKLITYQHCSHMLWIDQWEQFLQDIRDFLGHESL